MTVHSYDLLTTRKRGVEMANALENNDSYNLTTLTTKNRKGWGKVVVEGFAREGVGRKDVRAACNTPETRLSDLTPAAWTPVAERVPAGAVDAWSWRLAPGETAVFRDAVDAGRVLTAQRRRPDGGLELVARRVAAPSAALSHASADAAWDARGERVPALRWEKHPDWEDGLLGFSGTACVVRVVPARAGWLWDVVGDVNQGAGGTAATPAAAKDAAVRAWAAWCELAGLVAREGFVPGYKGDAEPDAAGPRHAEGGAAERDAGDGA